MRRGQAHHYTPRRTVSYEYEIWVMAQGAGLRQGTFTGGPLWLGLRAYFTRPPAAVFDFPIGKPDLDNIVKITQDALAPSMTNDSHIVGYLAGTGKFWGNPQRVEITLTDTKPNEETHE